MSFAIRNLILLVGLLFHSYATANFFSSVKKYSIEDGLPATTIYSIKKDKRGYFWLGTPSGLVRFDGYEFNVYQPNNDENRKIAFASAGNIFIDSKQRLWVGAWGEGAAVYDKHLNLLHWFKPNSNSPAALQSGMVQTFFEDRDGNIWLGTNGGGLARYREQSHDFENLIHDENNAHSLTHNRIWSISQDSAGNLWAATSDGLNKIEANSFSVTRFQHNENDPTSIDHPLVREVFVDEKDQIWIGTELSFGRFDVSSKTYIKHVPPNVFFNAAITRIRKAHDNALWIGTQRGLYRFDLEETKFTELVTEQKLALLPNDDIRDIYVSPSGELWVTTRYAGLSQITLEPSSFTSINAYKDVHGKLVDIQTIYDLIEDKNRKIWVGSSKGLLTFENSSLVEAKITGMPPQLEIFSLTVDGNNDLWVGSEDGIGFIDHQTQQFSFKNHIIGKTDRVAVINLTIDSVGNLWIGTNHWGLIKYRNGEATHYNHNPEDDNTISGDNVSHVMEDNKGRMWITVAGSGINRLDPERDKFFRYQASEELVRTSSFQNLHQVYQTKNGDIWFAGNNAFLKLNEVTDSFENHMDTSVLPSSNVKSLLEDDLNNLWLTTEFGISLYRTTQNYFVNYTTKDGLHGNQFFQRAALKSSELGLLFGGIDGLTIINTIPKSQTIGESSPVISAIYVDGKRIPDFSFDENNRLALAHNVKNIEIKFSSLNFAGENNQYRYRLKNFDDKWSKPTTQNNVVFSGLDSGNYVFQVNASMGDNIWSTFPAEINITITTPWWENQWIRLAILISTLMLGIAWYKTRTHSLKQQKLKLEQEVAEQTAKLLKAQKQLSESDKQTSISGLVAGVAHEINTPIGVSITAASNLKERCTKILNSIEQNKLKKSELTQSITNISDSAEMLLGNLSKASELVHTFKEVSVDRISQQKRQFNMRTYLAEIVASVSPKLKAAGIQIETQCPDDLVISSYPGAIAQLITQLALNSLIHAFDEGKAGKISIKIEQIGDNLHIRFCDDGKGIPESDKQRIFEPFYTTKRSSGASGLGLQIVSNIVKVRLGGEITCESTLGKGTCFEIVFLADSH